ncbi:hypothetical protein [Pseudactinotalea sp.]|uniref:hypothetical protein n=1 Tax=Pseudactinotalea sp. TaxID=1926260 RepID=UPI003B3B05C0
MSPTAVHRSVEASASPWWLPAALTQAAWCWLAVALAFAVARALVAVGADVPPAPFAGYSVLIFVLLPAVPALLLIAIVAAALRSAPPAWLQVAVVGLSLAGWAWFAMRSGAWTLGYGAAASAAAALAVLARTPRRTVAVRASVVTAGILAVGALWYAAEALA